MVNSVWIPGDEEELRRALLDGDVRESHWHEFKSVVGDKRGERSETARDLASFAIDGGVLIVGVAEDKPNNTYELAPFDLGQRMESLEQIARSRIDPPLQIRVSEIASTTSPGSGYLIVRIPASPDAPHMVDGVYYGRGDRTRHHLADTEVRRFHLQRSEDGELAMGPLHELIGRDPIPEGHSGHISLSRSP